MSTRKVFTCDFCGLTDQDQRITPMEFMGEDEDFHICELCNDVVHDLIKAVASVSRLTPSSTTHGGEKGLIRIIQVLHDD
jgi:hypothetical protein